MRLIYSPTALFFLVLVFFALNRPRGVFLHSQKTRSLGTAISQKIMSEIQHAVALAFGGWRVKSFEIDMWRGNLRAND